MDPQSGGESLVGGDRGFQWVAALEHLHPIADAVVQGADGAGVGAAGEFVEIGQTVAVGVAVGREVIDDKLDAVEEGHGGGVRADGDGQGLTAGNHHVAEDDVLHALGPFKTDPVFVIGGYQPAMIAPGRDHTNRAVLGGILAVGRAGGEVAPILFTGAAYYMRDLPKGPTDQFMDLGYHVFILSTQSPDIEKTRPILFATVLALLLLTLSLNLIAVIVRARVRKRMRGGH